MVLLVIWPNFHQKLVMPYQATNGIGTFTLIIQKGQLHTPEQMTGHTLVIDNGYGNIGNALQYWGQSPNQ